MRKIISIWVIICILSFCSNVYAQNKISTFQKLNFRLKLKEYACKVSDSSFRTKNNIISSSDLQSLQKNLYNKLMKYDAYYQEYVSFINENKNISFIFSEFNRLVQENVRFNVLQGERKSALIQNRPMILNTKAVYKPTYNDKLLFKGSYNVLLKAEVNKADKREDSSEEPQLTPAQKEYIQIINDIMQITDAETLQQHGSSIILRSEALLFGTDNSLDLDAVKFMLQTCASLKIKLVQFDVDQSTPEFQNKFIENVKEAYAKIKLPIYKYYSLQLVYGMYEYQEKYVEALNFALEVKTDIFELLTVDDKFGFAFFMGDIVCKCPVDQNYFKIGLDNYNLALELLESFSNTRAILPESIKSFTASVHLDGLAALQEKYGNYSAAIKELDIVIDMMPPETIYYKEAIKRKQKLLTLVKPIEIAKIVFLRVDGTEVKWGEILETGKQYIIRVITKQPCGEESIELKYYSDFTALIPKPIKLVKKPLQNNTIFENEITVDETIIGGSPENKTTFMTFDFVANGEDSSFKDSDAFEEESIKIGNIKKGSCRDLSSGAVASFDFNNPILPTTKDIIKSAGVEYLRITYNDGTKFMVPFSNQANILYFSSHGWHDSGNILINSTYNEKDKQLAPSEINKSWSSGLNQVIFAGCSVLDMKTPEDSDVLKPEEYPGYKWRTTGPQCFLGYRKKAPTDKQDNYVTTEIIKRYFSNFESTKDRCESWMKANNISRGYIFTVHIGGNACAIETNKKEYYYFVKSRNLGHSTYAWKKINY